MKKQQKGGAAAPDETIPSTPEELQEAMKPAAPVERFDLSADMFQRTMHRILPQGVAALKGGGRVIPLRKVSFQIDGAECADGVFVDDQGDYITFEITLQALDSATELVALREVKAGPEAPMVMARHALYAVNGTTLADDQKPFLWESLGMGGRQLVFAAFQSLGAASDAALGKYLSTRRES
jgi:hypothetical protein